MACKPPKMMNKPVQVMNMKTGNTLTYVGPDPAQAVIAAYAQSLSDWNTWDYATKYGAEISKSGKTVSCGDFVTLTR
jgi:hypothetical protein